MLTILGGQWGGRKLKAPDRDELRPTSGRVKAAIFSILEALLWKRSGQPGFVSLHCLDLYAGVGGLGLEALSRGAAHCVFVERSRTHAKALAENIHALGCDEKTEVLLGAVERVAWEDRGPFDLVLLDPPYAESHLPDLLARLANGPLRPGGIILFEHDPKVKLGEIAGLRLHSTRKLGPAGITVYVRDA